jgi:hypothetical protein
VCPIGCCVKPSSSEEDAGEIFPLEVLNGVREPRRFIIFVLKQTNKQTNKRYVDLYTNSYMYIFTEY